MKLTQRTSEGKARKDFERIKHLVEVGVDGVRANAFICRDYDRLCGRNEDGEYDKFGKSLESYIREKGLHLYQQRHWFNLNNIKHEIELTGKKADSKIEGKRIELRTNRGKFKNVQAGAPQSNPPFLWDFIIDKKGRGEQSVILGVYYYLIEDKVKLFTPRSNRSNTMAPCCRRS